MLYQSLLDIYLMFLILFQSAWTPGGHQETAAMSSYGTGWDQSRLCYAVV